MDSLIYVLSVTFGSVAAGYAARRLPGRFFHGITGQAVSKYLKLAAIFVLNPIAVVNSFWRLALDSGALFLLPVLGLISISLAGLGAVFLNAFFRIPPRRAASVFTCAAFTNTVSLGGLTAFAFFGHEGFAVVLLFNVFITVFHYAVGFPVSRQLSLESRPGISISMSFIAEKPYVTVPLLAIGAGLLLNVTGVPKPPVLDAVSAVVIPLVSVLIGFAIGLTLFFGKIGAYRKETALVALVKFALVPGIMIPLGLATGLPAVLDGTAFKVLVLLSFMPVGFNALVPPVVYGFDLDCANSAWVVTTLAVILILPVLVLAIQP